MSIYSIFDKVALEFGPLFEAKNSAVALRNFQMMFRRDKVSNPADFDLYQLGICDHDSGQISVQVPTVISSGSDFVDKVD